MSNQYLNDEINRLEKWANGNYFYKYATKENQIQKYLEEVHEVENALKAYLSDQSDANKAALEDELGDVVVTAVMYAAASREPIKELMQPNQVRCNYPTVLNGLVGDTMLPFNFNFALAMCNNMAFTYKLKPLDEVLKAVNDKLSKRQVSRKTACWLKVDESWYFVKKANFGDDKFKYAKKCIEFSFS